MIAHDVANARVLRPVTARGIAARPAAAEVIAPRPVSTGAQMMGGTVSVHLLDEGDPAALEVAAGRVLDRIRAWAARLTRHDAASELSLLNAASGSQVPVGPTLTEVLDWARTAEALTDGLVDVALLDARLAAEPGTSWVGSLPASRRWSLARTARGAEVRREPGLRFDLDGVAKGWLTDRALGIAPGRSALIDADGDLALRVAPGDRWAIGIADPRSPGERLAVVELAGDRGTPRCWGLATSGTTVHRWIGPAGTTHHIIDPRTLRSAATDVVQATVLATTAREAEAWAKVAVIAGSSKAFDVLDRPGVLGLLLLTDRGEVRATRAMARWLA